LIALSMRNQNCVEPKYANGIAHEPNGGRLLVDDVI
jgi:hypothetical protein